MFNTRKQHFLAKKKSKRKRFTHSEQAGKFYPLFFLCIWCQSLFFWRVLFILFPKYSTLKRGKLLEKACNHCYVYLELFCKWCFTDWKSSVKIINMKMCRMCFYSLGQGVSQSLVLPSREGKPTGPTAAARAGRTEEWSTTALLHTGRHASLGTLSVSPGEHKYRGRTSVLRSLHQSVNYTFKCFFYSLYVYYTQYCSDLRMSMCAI